MKKVYTSLITVFTASTLIVPTIHANLIIEQNNQAIVQEVEKETAIHLFINGIEQDGSQAIIEAGTTLVPMRSIFETLGASVKWDEQSKTVHATKKETTIQLKIRSYFAQKNDETIKLAVKPQIINGRTMVPLRFVSEALGANVKWDEQTRTITIDLKEDKAKEEENTVDNEVSENKDSTTKKDNQNTNETEEVEGALTLAEANQMALKQSYALKNSKENVKRWEEMRNSAADGVTYTPVGFGNSTDDAAALGSLLGLTLNDTQWRMAERQVHLTEEGIAFQVQLSFDEIIKKQNEIKTAEKVLENQQIQLKIMQVKVEHGTESKFNLTNAQTTLQEERQKLTKLHQELDDAYIKLNKLIGKADDERYSLEYTPDVEWLGEVDIETHTRRLINDNPQIWLKEQEIKMKQMGVDLYVFNQGGDPYKVKEIDVQTATNELANMKLDIEKDTLSRYNQMQQLETQYAILETNLTKAKNALQLVQAQYDAGMAIDAQLKEAELALAQLENQKVQLLISYGQLKQLFHKPWLAGGTV